MFIFSSNVYSIRIVTKIRLGNYEINYACKTKSEYEYYDTLVHKFHKYLDILNCVDVKKAF